MATADLEAAIPDLSNLVQQTLHLTQAVSSESESCSDDSELEKQLKTVLDSLEGALAHLGTLSAEKRAATAELVEKTVTQVAAARHQLVDSGQDADRTSLPQLDGISRTWEILTDQFDTEDGMPPTPATSAPQPSQGLSLSATARRTRPGDLMPHLNSMLHSLSGLSSAQKAGLVLRGHMPNPAELLKHMRPDPAMIIKYGLLSMAKTLPILAVYFLTMWTAMARGDYELALKLSAIAVKRTEDKKNCNESLAWFARGHAHQDWDESAVCYLRAMRILAQVPHTAFSLVIVEATSSYVGGLMDYLDAEDDKERALALVLEFERRLTTPATNNATLAKVLADSPQAKCGGLLGLCHWANFRGHYETAMRIYGKAESLIKRAAHTPECHCKGYSRWAGQHVYSLIMTNKRPEAEEVLRKFAPRDSAHPEDLEVLLKIKNAWHLKAVAEMWVRSLQPVPRWTDRSKLLCNLAVGLSQGGDHDAATETMATLIKTGAVPGLTVSARTQYPTTDIQAIYDFFREKEKTSKFMNSHDDGTWPLLSLHLWLRHIVPNAPPAPSTFAEPKSPKPKLEWRWISILIDVCHDLVRAGHNRDAIQILRDYRIVDELKRLRRDEELRSGCDYLTQCAKLWSLYRLGNKLDDATRLFKNLFDYKHGCCAPCGKGLPSIVGDETTAEKGGFPIGESLCSAAGYARHAAFLRAEAKKKGAGVHSGDAGMEVLAISSAATFYDGLVCVARHDRAGAMAKWKALVETLAAYKEGYLSCTAFQLVILVHRNMALLHRREGPVWDERQKEGDEGHDEWVTVSGDGLAVADLRGWDSRACYGSNCQNVKRGVLGSLEKDAVSELDDLNRRKYWSLWEALCSLG
ncbi:hypothetical protein QBC47DRAFT_174611 [Echria macrotheca]|uniref:Uncharacterized protein n=1 Tax=Echria macrotheca TaxID=438768 RepID=A0AAJ0F6N3_9PEZI|nr:hypothetical protein QBC47DRAFT_174611 [Echria macrotheca]